MTESLQEAIRPSYEDLRDSCPIGEDSDGSPAVGTLWRDADRWREHLSSSVAKVAADESLSESGKQAKIEEAYNRWTPKITKPAQQARAKAQKLAYLYAAQSIPMPDGSNGHTSQIKDAAELSAVQSEAREITEAASSGTLADAIERSTGKRPKNITEATTPADALRDYFGDGLETGGIEGKVRCHATLRAAKSLGIDPEEVYGEYRGEGHTSLLAQASRYDMVANSIPTAAPNIGRGVVQGSHWRKSGTPRALLTGGPNSFLPQKRRAHWK